MKYSVEIVRNRLRRLIREGFFPVREPLPKIQQLAGVFGVSIATVQEAIHRLREEGLVDTRRGYGVFVKYPLKWNSRGKRIGLLTPFRNEFLDNDPYPGVSLSILRDRLQEKGYSLVPFSLKDTGIIDVPGYLRKKKLAGLILLEVPGFRLIEDLSDLNIPIVSMDCDAFQLAVPSVLFDNLDAGFALTRHLIGRGHRNIVYIRRLKKLASVRSLLGNHATLDAISDEHMRGYRLAMKDAGLVPTQFEFTQPSDGDDLRALWDRPDAPTAILSDGYQLKSMLLKHLSEWGLKIPEDVSFVDFDDDGEAFEPDKRITTLKADYGRFGESTADLFFEALAGHPPRRVVLDLKLNERDSVMSPKVSSRLQSV